jgi:predicted site-specific integrase-resolvase
MAKKKKNTNKTEEQMDLLDVHPQEAKQILSIAKNYKDVVNERVKLTKKETDLKEKLKSLIRSAGLTPMADGTIKFSLDGYSISMQPRDELIRVAETGTSKKRKS